MGASLLWRCGRHIGQWWCLIFMRCWKITPNMWPLNSCTGFVFSPVTTNWCDAVADLRNALSSRISFEMSTFNCALFADVFDIDSLFGSGVWGCSWWIRVAVALAAPVLLFTPQPSGLEGYCHGPGGRPGGRAGGCQTCGTHISVTAWWIFSIRSSVELSRPGVHCHGHMPICPIHGPKLVKFATNWVQTLRNA